MKYNSTINNVKCLEWDLTLSQAFLLDLLPVPPHWARTEKVNDTEYYWVSRNKVLEEIPNAFKTPDTVYRALKDLNRKGVIEHIKLGRKDLVRLTKKGLEWMFKTAENPKEKVGNNSELDENSEKNPGKVGNKSEKQAQNSEKNPTDNGTSNHGTSNKKEREGARSEKFIKPDIQQVKNYFEERGHPTPSNESEKWFDYYTANGWKVGKNPMKDWKASIRNWIRKDNQVQHQGNNHAVNQGYSTTGNGQAKKSSADIYAENLARDLAERFPDEFPTYQQTTDC